MRLVQLTIPTGKRETILGALDDEGVDYVVTDETSGREFTGVVYFPLPANAVEPVLDTLQDIGVSEDAYTVVVDAETVVSRKFDDLEERYATDDVEEERISRQELRTEAEEMTPNFPIYVTLTLISAFVATAGLLLDSPAVVVGSMVIAPLIGPALGASVGTVINDDDLVREGLLYQALGIGLAIAGAAVLAFGLKVTHLVPPDLMLTSVGEINERLTPDLLSLIIALGAGVAGVLSLSTGVSTALVGVMIAAALIPPAAAAGIALAWGLPLAGLGSAVLVLVNITSVNLAGLVTLWYMGYRPGEWFEEAAAQRKLLRNAGLFAVAMIVLSSFLVGASVTGFQTANFETEVQTDLTHLLDQSEYEQYQLLSVQIEMTEDFPFRHQERVIVTVGQTGDATSQSAVTDEIYAAIENNSERDVAVQVRYVDIDQRGNGEAFEPSTQSMGRPAVAPRAGAA
ncbi:TIGR00341 family protein [Natronoarchaeum philippinense]|uniref:TIGR00341 family protein n=1 Tax=Natronoarchaeum philippinense TaxID=558529 RepID=A0A285NQW6_NATPI|nr:TIGR00341 family protein [Natronoarchaeum philippinense]SNZ11902.1 TIGR00341 family protein [Natronoarchaeum philippinense]